MRRRASRPGGWFAPLLAALFVAGVLVGWWLRGGPPQPAESAPIVTLTPPVPGVPTGSTRAPTATAAAAPAPSALGDGVEGSKPAIPAISADTLKGEPTIGSTIQPPASAIDELARRDLRLPIDHVSLDPLKGMFEQGRDNNRRPHEAVDILAPRNTPIHAVENGTIAKLFFSKAGGNTVYQFDPDQRFCYYYAHLEQYAPGLQTGQRVTRGDVIGYVGTSGNAPPGTPHLHFTIFALDGSHRWWQGRPIDPYLVFDRARHLQQP